MPTITADAVVVEAVDQAREAALAAARDFGVGEYLGHQVDQERCITHRFACTHPGYVGWTWQVAMVRASRSRTATINEVELVAGPDALRPPRWIPWHERVLPGDITPGLLLPTPDNDERVEPGYTGADRPVDEDPAEWSMTRAVVGDLGLGRERVMSRQGRDETVERWLAGPGGPDNQMTRMAPGHCRSCAYFTDIRGSLGLTFGVCANEYSPSDGRVVSHDHGCGGHSDVASEDRGVELPEAVYDTITTDSSIWSD